MTRAARVVVGTWPLSGDYGPVSLTAVERVLAHCYDKGLREFDTAPSYGNGFAEFCLGNVLRGRSDVLINTKVGNIPFQGKCFDVDRLERSLSESLKRLSIERVNVLFLHNPRDVDFRPLLDLMRRLKEAGRIRCTGISLAARYDYRGKADLDAFDVVQDDASLLKMSFLGYGLSRRTRFMARSPMANGLLCGRIGPGTVFPEEDHRSGWLHGERLASLLRRVAAIRASAGIPLPNLARRFVLRNSRIHSVVFGVKEPRHVDDILEDLEAPALDDETEKALVRLYDDDFGIENERHLGF